MFMVSRCLWYRTRSGKGNQRKNKMIILNRRIQLWKENKIMDLWNSFKEEVNKMKRRRKARTQEDEQKNRKKKNDGKRNKMMNEKKVQQNGEENKYKLKRTEYYVNHNDIKSATNMIMS